MSKMTGKQEIVGGFDLSAFVGEAEEKKETSHPKPQKQPEQPEQRGRKKEPDPLSEVVQMKLTKSEMDTLKQKIGLVPISKWLRNELKQNRII